jgi:hypothetical protein
MQPTKHSSIDLALAVKVSPGDTYEWSNVLLARAPFNGTLELLTAAWGRVLGYGREELKCKTLGQIMGDGMVAATAVSAIFAKPYDAPVTLTLRCRDGSNKSFRLHRRHDNYTNRLYLVAEEMPGPPAGALHRADDFQPLAQPPALARAAGEYVA